MEPRGPGNGLGFLERSRDVTEQLHHLDVVVEELLKHRAVDANRRVAAKHFRHLLDGASDIFGL